MKSVLALTSIAALLGRAIACGGDDDDCYGPIDKVEHVRLVKRIQPGAPDAPYGPKGPLEWGQINFMHTTDTHGWLAGHLKEENYGADWGDFATFTRHMRQKADDLGVDFLLVDTGDLHDGAGLSDATTIDGTKSMPIFSEIEYDLLTIGNHELYVTEVAKQMFNEYAKKWGDRYLTSNVKVYNDATKQYEHVGATHRYFTTKQGIRIMAFGVLFDFTGNSNASQVIKAKDMVKETWFQDAIHTDKPVDLFVLLGHNPVRQTDYANTFTTVWNEIRAVHKNTPITIFGGHSHIRDFAVYDQASVGIEAGRYCETLGWVSQSGFSKCNSGYHGAKRPDGKKLTRKATDNSTAPWVYSRRYLDWNRNTFMYHISSNKNFDSQAGLKITQEITTARKDMNLGEVYGCAPETYCISCVPFDDPKNIFPGVIKPAVNAIVLNEARKDKARMIIGNTGAIRFDLYKGPFTYDDNFVVSPFRDVFRYLPDVPFDKASQVLAKLNKGTVAKRDFASMPISRDDCVDPLVGALTLRDMHQERGIVRRQETITPGYATKDDWGTDGDDTEHTGIPNYTIPSYWESRAGFPTGSDPEKVDLIFFDFIEKYVLQDLGSGFTSDMVSCYINCTFTSQDFMLPYAKLQWQDNIDNCPIGA
ncbi:hypothetical protein V2G26_018534 [Clonostachys chloroleuca]